MNTCGGTLSRHALRLCAAISVAGLMISLGARSALADTVSDKRAQAQALAAQIDALGNREAALSEQYDKAVLGTQTTGDQVQQAETAFAAAEANAQRVRSTLQAEAVDSYMHGGTLATVAGRAGPTGVINQVLRGVYIKTLAGSQADTLDAYRAAAAEEREAKAALDDAQQAQQQSVAKVAGARSATIAAEQQLQGQLGRVNGDIVALVAQADAARVAAAATRTHAAAARSTTVGASIPVPVGSGTGEAVAAAKTRLGDPYQWGAAGPDEFDCSGLTMWSWAHAGVSLPHYSGSQYASTEHIPISEVQPGDLVYPSDPDQHVAMYIGGGEIINAPHTGADVRIEPLSSWYVLASRP